MEDNALTYKETVELFGEETAKNIIALQSGKITLAEYKKNIRKIQEKATAPKLLEYRANGQWEDFVSLALLVPEVLDTAFKYYAEVPDNLKYKLAVKAYTDHGDYIPAVRKAVRGALKYGKPTLPKELADLDEVTVYRAGEEPIQKARYRISWTTDLNVALFFLNEWNGRHAEYLYKGKIKPENIIGYTDARNEKEVMQYMNVYDIEDITGLYADRQRG